MADRLNIRIDETDKEKLRRAAKVENRSLSNFIKTAAMEKAERLLSNPAADQVDAEPSDSE